LPERDSVLLNLDMIADEAFQAGELIKELQREIRDEKPSESDNEAADISSMLNQLAIVRYGSDPNLHYLRENPGVSFVADLSSVTPVSGTPSEIKPLLGEVLQWTWDEYDIDDHIRIKLLDRGDHSYLISSDRSFTDDDLDIDDLAFRPLGMHPDLSNSEAVAGLSTASVSFCERSTEDGDRILYLRFEKTQVQSTERNDGSLNILAIDDQEIIRELLTGMLDQLGYNVTVCSTGAEGVEVFNAGVYDLVITDIGLPDLDGWQVVEKVRAADPGVPVIMISGWGLDEEVEKAGEYGVDHILPKPFRLENLSELIEKVKSRRATA
jgi:CheY-like chemotaxis protein